MAATSAAAVGSPFSTSMQTLKSIPLKTWPCDHIFKITSTPMLQVSSVSHSAGIESVPIAAVVSHKWRVLRISAAVAQGEAGVTAAVEEEGVVEEAEQVKEEGEVPSGGVAVAEAEESAINTKLYFGNLPYHCDSAQLAGIIQDYGSPELIEVLYDRETGRSRGFAFVTMSSLEDCKSVIESLDGREYGGRTLRVNFSDKPKPKEPLYPETEYKLFVGNLAWSVTSESLTELFQQHGNVVGARVLYDGETGRSRGYGFVSYSTKSEMDAACQSLNGVELDARSLRVSLAQGKQQ